VSQETRALTLTGENIQHRFPRSDFTLNVEHIEAPAGTTLVLLGPSGSGKSTLLNILGLLEKPDRGRILLDGREVTHRDRAARLDMAAVFQRAYLFKGSVEQNVAYGLTVRGVPKAERAAKVSSALERVGLGGYESRSALSLSGGEAQRVSLARALVIQPKVLLLDEPLANLDPLLKRRLTREFAAIVKETGATVVWVTHDQDEAFVAADQIAIIRDGSVVAQGTADKVMTLPSDEWAASFLGIEEPSSGTVYACQDGLITVSAGPTHVYMVGEAPIGSTVAFSVRPEDVVLFSGGVDIPQSTARNLIQGTVSALDPRGASTHVTIDAPGLRLAASVSRTSVSDLALAPGAPVTAVFKATAVRWD